MRFSLKKKILLPTVILVILVMGCSGFITYHFFSKSLNEKVVSQLSAITRAKRELIDNWTQDMKVLMLIAASRSVYVSLLQNDIREARDEVNRELAEQVKLCPWLSYVNLIDATGTVIASSLPDAVGKVKLADREYFQRAMKGEENISSVYIARTTGKPAFAVAAPIRKGDGVIGVIAGAPDLAKFKETFIDPVKVLRSGYVAIADSADIIFAHPDDAVAMKLNLNDHEFGREMLKRKGGSLNYEFQGKNLVAFFEQSELSHWMVLTITPYNEIVEDVNRMALNESAVCVVGLLLITLVLFIIANSIAGPINRVGQGLEKGVESVAVEATQVASASRVFAKGASQQAASIENTSSALEKMASMTTQNSDNAAQAHELMTETAQAVSVAFESMGRLTASMLEISKASAETSKIIRTIDEIAFQTNLLALNAAVEAARAGETGAGFAVVADEVRNLAMRSAEAARSTADLIEYTVKIVKEGSEIVEKTDHEFRQAVISVGKSSELVSEIAAASLEQAHGIDQVNRAVGEMDKVVQQNAANAEQSAAAATQMNTQADQMRDRVGDLKQLIYGT